MLCSNILAKKVLLFDHEKSDSHKQASLEKGEMNQVHHTILFQKQIKNYYTQYFLLQCAERVIRLGLNLSTQNSITQIINIF